MGTIGEMVEQASFSASYQGATLSVLVEPTSACNLNCQYCYKGNKSNITMGIRTLERMIKQIVAYNEGRDMGSSFIWHGGEPTMVEAQFYKKAFKIIDGMRCEHKIGHTVQTNGTLLNDEILDLFAERSVSVSVSLDGPAEYHDKLRPFWNGNPSHGKVLEGIARAKAKGIEIGILMSITNENLTHIREMFEYCRENRFTLGLNPVSADFHSPHTHLEVTPENYLEACIDIFDLWFYQKEFSIQVNPGFGVTRLLLSKNRLSDCFMSENCQMHFISIGPEGDIYPCNRFYGIRQFKFGNILENDFSEVMGSRQRQYLLDRCTEKIDSCKGCFISQYCNGGCMHHAAVHNNSIYSSDHLCFIYRGLVEHALKRLDMSLLRGKYNPC